MPTLQQDMDRLSAIDVELKDPKTRMRLDYSSRLQQEAADIQRRVGNISPEQRSANAQAQFDLNLARQQAETARRQLEAQQAQLANTAQITERLPEVTLERLGTAEEQAQRAQLARQLMSQQQAAQRQLAQAQARGGIRGGGAAAQQARLARQLEAERSQQEEAGFLQRRQFNLQQAQREQFAKVASELARRNLMASLRGAEMQSEAAKEFGRQQIAAAQASGGGGCCAIAVVIKAGLFPSITAVQANEIIYLSKNDPVKLYEEYGSNLNVINAIEDLNKTRYVRDNFTTKKELRGYYKISETIAPFLEKYPKFTKVIGKSLIVNPIMGIPNNNLLGKLYLKIFNLFGSNKPFIRNNGEIV